MLPAVYRIVILLQLSWTGALVCAFICKSKILHSLYIFIAFQVSVPLLFSWSDSSEFWTLLGLPLTLWVTYYPEDDGMPKAAHEVRSKLNIIKSWISTCFVYLVQWRCMDITNRIVILMQLTPFALHYDLHRDLKISGVVAVPFSQIDFLRTSALTMGIFFFTIKKIRFFLVLVFTYARFCLRIRCCPCFYCFEMLTSPNFPFDLSCWSL